MTMDRRSFLAMMAAAAAIAPVSQLPAWLERRGPQTPLSLILNGSPLDFGMILHGHLLDNDASLDVALGYPLEIQRSHDHVTFVAPRHTADRPMLFDSVELVDVEGGSLVLANFDWRSKSRLCVGDKLCVDLVVTPEHLPA